MTHWTHEQYINRINLEGRNLKNGMKGHLALHKTLLEVEQHLADTFDEERPWDTEPDDWITLYHRWLAARKFLDKPRSA